MIFCSFIIPRPVNPPETELDELGCFFNFSSIFFSLSEEVKKSKEIKIL